MNKEKTGILRDDITLKEFVEFQDDYRDTYLTKIVANMGQRFTIGFLHLPESFFKTVTNAYPAEVKDMATDGQLGVSGGEAVVLVAFDKAKAAPFNVRSLATGTVSWNRDFSPKGDSIKSIVGPLG